MARPEDLSAFWNMLCRHGKCAFLLRQRQPGGLQTRVVLMVFKQTPQENRPWITDEERRCSNPNNVQKIHVPVKWPTKFEPQTRVPETMLTPPILYLWSLKLWGNLPLALPPYATARSLARSQASSWSISCRRLRPKRRWSSHSAQWVRSKSVSACQTSMLH